MAISALAEIVSGVRLRDPALFRQQCYVGGDWVDAESGATFDVTDPASGQPIGVVPSFGRGRNPASRGSGQRRVSGLARADRERTFKCAASMV